MSTKVIEATVQLSPLGFSRAGELLTATLRYDPADPLAVTLLLPEPDGGALTWTFSRDVLCTGLAETAGGWPALVTVWPGPVGHIHLGLRRGEWAMAVAAPSADLMAFVIATYAAVASGREQVDPGDTVAEFLDRCLNGGPS